MAEKKKEQALVVSQKMLEAGIFSMWLKTEAAYRHEHLLLSLKGKPPYPSGTQRAEPQPFQTLLREQEMQLVRGLDVGNLLEHIHQFRQVEELRKSGSGTIAGSLRCKLNRSCCFSEGRCPGIKMGQVLLLKRCAA